MTPCTSTEAIRRIEAYVQSQNWTRNHLAEQAGLRFNTLRHFGTEKWNPTLKILRQVEAVIPEHFNLPSSNNRGSRNRKAKRG